MAELTDDDCETLGLLADKMDNFAHGALLPLPAHIHVAALTGAVEDARDELKAFLRSKGFDPWGEG